MCQNEGSSPMSNPPSHAPSEQPASFEQILSEFEESHRHAGEGRRESRQGTVVAISPELIFVDVGLKTEGVLPAGEFRDASGKLTVQLGDPLVVAVKGRDEGGYYLLSKVKIERPKDWTSLERAFQEKRAIAGVVTGVVKGGLSVDVGVRAFLPASRSGVRDSAELEKLVGQEIRCRITKLDASDEDVVVDRRVIAEEEAGAARERRYGEIREGEQVHGVVRSLTGYGAFVDIGGVDGLLHVGDISWQRLSKPADVLSVGDEVEAPLPKCLAGFVALPLCQS